jgi:hypothetical protein
MKRITFFVLLLHMELFLYAQNLVINPGFDSWVSVTRPMGWTHVENCTKDSSFFVSGNYSCRHSGGTTSTSDLGQTMYVSPGKIYTLSFFYRTTVTSTGNGGRIWCYWKDASGNNINDVSSDAVLRPSEYLKSDIWRQFSITVTAPPSASAFYLEVRTYAGSTSYWDDFVFRENVSTSVRDAEFPDLTIFPNPASNLLNICNFQKFNRLEITDLTGKHVWSSGYSGETSITIPLYGIPDGIYIVKMETGNEVISRKFIKKTY